MQCGTTLRHVLIGRDLKAVIKDDVLARVRVDALSRDMAMPIVGILRGRSPA
jgi:hypothetical protein